MSYLKVFKATNRAVITAFLLFASHSVSAFEALQCPIGAPLASWDFNAGDTPTVTGGHVEWANDHGGLVPVPDTHLKGIKFNYRGKETSEDSTSEWRYKMTIPLAQNWEYLKFYQPKNFYHRHAVRISSPEILSTTNWRKGDEIINSKGMRGVVSQVKDKFLYVEKIHQRFDHNWGKGIVITNKTTGGEFESLDSRSMATNNKLSAQWQGRYSNAGMIVEFANKLPAKGGEHGVGYFSPKVNTSKAHKASGSVSNQLFKMPGTAFDIRDNGIVVEFVIQRTRSSAEGVSDAIYRIWKRTENSSWSIVHENTSLYAWQPDNYFDHGYVMGWANSGYEEDTTFYLLGWELWAEKPAFLP